jgi:hypothetical protein
MSLKDLNLLKVRENEAQLYSAKFVTNGSSAPDGLSSNLTSVTRTAAGKYTLVFDDNFPAVLWGDVLLVGAAGYKAHVTSIDTASNGNVNGCKLEVWANASVASVASGGTLTGDTKANSTDLDYYILNDGQASAMLWYNVSGTQAAKYAKVSAPAAATITCDTKANTANEGYFTIFDGRNSWDIMMDTDASGDSTGNAHVVVDVSGATTAADIVALIVADVNAQAASATLDTPEETFHVTAAASGNDVVFTSTIDGYDTNGACSLTSLVNGWAKTNMIGGVDAFPADEFAEVDISGATTATDVQTVIHGVINALTEVRITSTDPADGDPLTLANDEVGVHGNTSQVISETGSTLMALTDMTGGTSGVAAAAAADTTDYDVYLAFLLRNSKLTFR